MVAITVMSQCVNQTVNGLKYAFTLFDSLSMYSLHDVQ